MQKGVKQRNDQPMMRTRLLSCLVFLFVLGATACAHSSTEAQNSQAQFQGKKVYDQWCAPCHEAKDLHLIKEPPRLDGLFRKPALPSGLPATDQQVRVILEGRGIMPPFQQAVNGDDLDALMQYLHNTDRRMFKAETNLQGG